MNEGKESWEDVLADLKARPEWAEFVRHCYLDDPVASAAERFRSSLEWCHTQRIMGPPPGRILEIGAGRCIAANALADAGWTVVACEPSDSALTGTEAARGWLKEVDSGVTVVRGWGEHLPFQSGVFDRVYCRQVLHHAGDLHALCREVGRVLRPGGRLLATREHVISRDSDREVFLVADPIRRRYEGEDAYTLKAYHDAFCGAGLTVRQIWGPLETPINYSPSTWDDCLERCRALLVPRVGYRLAVCLTSKRLGTAYLGWLFRWVARYDDMPGRLYSFELERPAGGLRTA